MSYKSKNNPDSVDWMFHLRYNERMDYWELHVEKPYPNGEEKNILAEKTKNEGLNEARFFARKKAEERNIKTGLMVHRKDGSVSDTHTYGVGN